MNEDSRNNSAVGGAIKLGIAGGVGYGAHKALTSSAMKNRASGSDNLLSKGVMGYNGIVDGAKEFYTDFKDEVKGKSAVKTAEKFMGEDAQIETFKTKKGYKGHAVYRGDHKGGKKLGAVPEHLGGKLKPKGGTKKALSALRVVSKL